METHTHTDWHRFFWGLLLIGPLICCMEFVFIVAVLDGILHWPGWGSLTAAGAIVGLNTWVFLHFNRTAVNAMSSGNQWSGRVFTALFSFLWHVGMVFLFSALFVQF